jgi:stage V sporulation protein R
MGVELFRDIEDRWNRGKFGPEFEACEDVDDRRRWNKGIGLGKQKVFEVRKIYNDISFVDEFVGADFADAQKLYVYGYDQATNRYVIVDREWKKVKEQLLSALTNFGQPIIYVVDANHKNRGELYLLHDWAGADLDLAAAQRTLRNVHALWKRPVHIETREGGKGRLLTFDGEEETIKEITPSKEAAQIVAQEKVAGP